MTYSEKKTRNVFPIYPIKNHGYFCAWQEEFKPKPWQKEFKTEPKKYLVIAREKDGNDAIVFESLHREEAKKFSDDTNHLFALIIDNNPSLVDISLIEIADCLRT